MAKINRDSKTGRHGFYIEKDWYKAHYKNGKLEGFVIMESPYFKFYCKNDIQHGFQLYKYEFCLSKNEQTVFKQGEAFGEKLEWENKNKQK